MSLFFFWSFVSSLLLTDDVLDRSWWPREKIQFHKTFKTIGYFVLIHPFFRNLLIWYSIAEIVCREVHFNSWLAFLKFLQDLWMCWSIANYILWLDQQLTTATDITQKDQKIRKFFQFNLLSHWDISLWHSFYWV